MKKLKLQKNIYAGKLIVFEGIDGSGKTTLINFTMQYLQKLGYDCVYVKMPSDRMRNLKIFNDYDNSKDDTARNSINLTNLTIMVNGDRLVTQDEIIIPALKQNKIVICDRYCFTGFVRCTDKIIKNISSRFLRPDLTFLCDCDVEKAKQRIFTRKNEKDNFYDEQDVKKQKHNFLKLAHNNNFVVIDTNNSLEFCKTKIEKYIEKVELK